MKFSFEQARKYFAYRLPDENVSSHSSLSVRCPFHPDRTASLSIKLTDGVWNCHAGCGGGGILDFERKMFPTGDPDQWWGTITKICGLEPNRRGERDLGKLVATYDYNDATGRLLFQKLRYEPKNFIQRASNGKGGWEYRLNGVSKPLYRLPALIVSQVALVAEGEKDADALQSLDWQSLKVDGKPMPTVAATCNFDGAGPGKWKDEYAAYFAGRVAVVFPDNDTVGKAHAAEVAASIARCAHSVKIVELPGLAEHGDVSDYLTDHTVSDLAEVIKTTPRWEPPKEDEQPARPFFVCPSEIMRGHTEVEWIVPGIIHRGGKGLIVAAPKAGKSMLALDLAVALASQQSWLGQPCLSRRVKVALVSREDGPGMTARRVGQFARARGVTMESLDPWLLFNTHEQKSSFSIDNDADLDELTRWVKREGVELVVFDVLNILHSADENSNTAMTQVMKRFDTIKAATGADIAIIHHDKKDSESGNKKPRGASAIDSWWEWKVSVSPQKDDENTKVVYFGSKACMPRAALTIEFRSDEDDSVRIFPAVGKR